MAKAAEKATDKAAADDQAVTPRPPMLSDYGLALSVYVLYLLGFFTGLTAVIGLIIASMQVDRAEPVSRSHFRFQIRTFWIGLLFLVAGIITVHIAHRRGDPSVVGCLDFDPMRQRSVGAQRRRADRRSGVVVFRLSVAAAGADQKETPTRRPFCHITRQFFLTPP